MDKNPATINSQPPLAAADADADRNGGWTTVPCRYRRKLYTPSQTPSPISTPYAAFHSVVDAAEIDLRLRDLEAQRAALDEVTAAADSDGDAAAGEVSDALAAAEVKEVEKVKVSVPEAAAKIDCDDLASFLVKISGWYELPEDVELMRFADYMGRAFGSVGSAQFPWMNLFEESSVSQLLDIPLCHVPEAVYKTSVDWLGKHSVDALGSFVLWLWDGILAKQPFSKSQVALFVVMGMTLRRKPEVLISLLPILKKSGNNVGHDKLHLTVWVIAQASQGDLVVGLYMWVQILLPMLIGKLVNPQSRDLILQLVERILGMPKARQILLNGPVRKGKRLVPPSAFDTLMRLTFPPVRVEVTERFEAIYPILKEVALAGVSGSKMMKQVIKKILTVVIETAGEGVPELSKEASDVLIWCLTESPDCFKQWDDLYLNNIKASALLLKRLYSERKLQSTKSANLKPVKAALNSFWMKNRNALASEEHADDETSLKEADKYCKLLLNQFSKDDEYYAIMISAVGFVCGTVANMCSNYVQSGNLEGLLSRFGLKF